MTPKEKLVIKFNHIILIQGFNNFSMAQLAKMADISRATLYTHFKNKEEIVESVVERHLRFIQTHPLPDKAKKDNFLQTIINSLLLIGSTTDNFESELKNSYPRMYREFTQSIDEYLNQLLDYYQKAQAEGLLIKEVTPEYLLFQNKLNIRGILKNVQEGNLTLDQGEKYLIEYFLLQMHSLTGTKVKITSEVSKFKDVIINEYYDTYSLV